ncbi:glutathione S-transferase L3 isoform X3 [Amborella trichopoda]|uniref:glutathione S-transferase L3 isoform X3 n=1 Tax=Amborella trichopoda TaxID=13333 RepID=UPI0009C077AD|nr:glutathione S-transferase L3 isoform X3 [Amborella trichopoda]|eukprot:XP_011627221.2 glutathione S-transferase L3 isoform X3 [Amborella trichopoda]
MKKLLHVYTIMICYGNLGSMALAHGLSCDFRSKYSLTSLPVTACATAPQYSCPIFRERFLPLQISQNPFLSPLTVPERHVLSPKSIPRVHFLSLDSLRRRYHKQTEVVSGVEEELPPEMVSTSEPPNLFDGTTRLYISYVCPFAQRVWIARNYKGLQDEMKLVPINLANRPSWYKEKVYPPNQVPALEHNKKVIGESLDLLYYLDTHFEGPKLLPDDPAKRTFAEELIGCCGDFIKVRSAFSKEDIEEEVGPPCDYLESALSKFDFGPFFLGECSMVDMLYAPFIERFHLFLLDVKKYDITYGRPRLATWIEEINKLDAYTQTKRDPEDLLHRLKQRYLSVTT